ncbi:uncharacterized protein O3C94_015207 [Discoglossus pictus]
MRTVLLALGVLLICDIGHTLECYSCDYGTCLFPSKITCSGVEVCVTEKSSVTEYLSLKKKGCMDPVKCLSDSSVTYVGVTVTTKPSCCITNLCNSATMPRVSLITAVCAVVAIWLVKMS